MKKQYMVSDEQIEFVTKNKLFKKKDILSYSDFIISNDLYDSVIEDE
jgi:hypothetical protein